MSNIIGAGGLRLTELESPSVIQSILLRFFAHPKLGVIHNINRDDRELISVVT